MSTGVKAVKYTGDEVVYGILRRGPLADLVPGACARQTELKRPLGGSHQVRHGRLVIEGASTAY